MEKDFNPSKAGSADVNNAIFFNCDIQSKFNDIILGYNNVVTVGQMMAKTSKVLQIPILITEQNRKVFQTTVEEITKEISLDLTLNVEKSTFSMVNEDTLPFLKKFPDRNVAVLYGVETHVCVQQTCLDLLNMGYQVHLLVDGVSSSRQLERTAGIKRMEKEGVIITTAESLIFELLKSHKNPKFKEMLPIIKTPRVNPFTDI